MAITRAIDKRGASALDGVKIVYAYDQLLKFLKKRYSQLFVNNYLIRQQ